jgi:excisionase family DNA binding protein
MTAPEKPRWLTVKEVAHLLDLSEVSVRRKIRAGQIPGVFQLGGPGNAIRILEGELERWLLTDVSDGSRLGQLPTHSPFERHGTQAMSGQSNRTGAVGLSPAVHPQGGYTKGRHSQAGELGGV